MGKHYVFTCLMYLKHDKNVETNVVSGARLLLTQEFHVQLRNPIKNVAPINPKKKYQHHSYRNPKGLYAADICTLEARLIKCVISL